MKFRISAKNIFLTYPKATIIPDELYDYLSTKRAIKNCRIATEKHKDGSDHCHALVEFVSKQDIRDEREFDYKEYHPNIQTARNIQASRKYLEKEGNYQDYGSDFGTRTSLYDKANEMDEPSFYEYCREERIPFQYAEHAWKFTKGTFTIEEPRTEGTIREDLSRLRLDKDDRRSIIIIGTSGIGKTTWAIREAPKPTLFVSHIDRLRDFNPKVHKSIVFDDLTFKHMPITAQISIVDRDMPRDIHIRYGVASIPEGVVKIFTCNEEPFENYLAINRRTIKHLFY